LWEYGYPFTLVLMVLAAVVPLLVFKWKKWLYTTPDHALDVLAAIDVDLGAVHV
jgi:membrane protein YdbS with pleckstrin-like domain